MRHEARDQTLWSKYVEDQNEKKVYFYYELKQTRGNSFPFDSFEDQQKPSLLALERRGMAYKFSDADPRKKPCDGGSFRPEPTYVVIKYPKAYVMIRTDNFILESGISKRKSLTYERAINIAHKVIHTGAL